MKNILVLIFCFLVLKAGGQDNQVEFNGKTWIAPYSLSKPQGWDVERFTIPISFAPTISYKGIEDIRFTPGWGKATTTEYWSYAFLWYLDGLPEMNEKTIEENLKAYYTGLVGGNIESRKITAEKLVPITTSVKKAKASKNDLATYTGTIKMLDYMAQLPITMNCIIHFRPDKEKNKTFVFYEISPRPYSDDVWKSLDKLWSEFDINKQESKSN